MANQQTETEKEQIFLPLMKFESSTMLLMEPGITTINFFSSDREDKIHYDTSLRMLKSRMKKICEANPWLVGRLIRDKQKRKGLLCCAFPKQISDEDIDSIFVTKSLSEMESLSSSTPYPDITKAMKKSGAIVKNGHQLINRDDRVTKLTFLPIANGAEYAMCFSLAHAVADGFTYYRILSMLSSKKEIESLQEERVQNFESTVTESIGLEEQNLSFSPWLLANIMSSYIFSSPMQVSANFVDVDKVAKAKEDAKNRHPEDPNFYISTNDILTSSFGRESGADTLLMAFNLRGRHKNAGTESHAGNYETVFYYDEASFETPDVIRESLRNGPPYKRSSGNKLPGWLKQLRMKFSFVTSWSFSYFDADLHLWNSQEIPSHLVNLHLPIYDVHGIPPIPMGIIFKPCNNKLAMMYFYPPKSKFYKNKDNANSWLGNTVNGAIFVD